MAADIAANGGVPPPQPTGPGAVTLEAESGNKVQRAVITDPA